MNNDPICPQCSSTNLIIMCKRSRNRWNITQKCKDCGERRFYIDKTLTDGVARLPRPEPEQMSLASVLPAPRQRYEY